MKTRKLQNILYVTFAIGTLAILFQDLRAQEINLEDKLILHLPMNGSAQDESDMNIPTLVENLLDEKFG